MKIYPIKPIHLETAVHYLWEICLQPASVWSLPLAQVSYFRLPGRYVGTIHSGRKDAAAPAMRNRTAFVRERSLRCIPSRRAYSPSTFCTLPSVNQHSDNRGTGCRDLPGCSPEHLILRRRHVRQLEDPHPCQLHGMAGLGIQRFTYAALTRRRFVCGWPSVATKRICLGAEEVPPFFFLGDGSLMTSDGLSVTTTHWIPVHALERSR